LGSGLDFSDSEPELARLTSAVAGAAARTAGERAALVAISGIDGAGKGYVAAKLAAEQKAAEEIALNIKGQKKVVNHLTVVPKADRKVVDRQDDQIVKDVEKGIKNDARLKEADIDVRADKGIVTLTGKAPSLETSVHASEVARRVPGVRAVRNEVKLERKG